MVVSSLASNHNKDDDVGVNSSISKIPSLSSSRSKTSLTPSPSVSVHALIASFMA